MAGSASDCVALGKSYHLLGLGFTIGLREGGVDRYLPNGVLLDVSKYLGKWREEEAQNSRRCQTKTKL